MSSDDRIEKLERQIEELKELVAHLQGDNATPADSAEPAAPAPAAAPKIRERYKSDVRRNVDRVLGGEAGDTLETRIAGIWLSRIGAVVLMTAVILGAQVTIYEDYLGPLQKMAILYGGSTVALAYGLLAGRRGGMFQLTILGVGLAGAYFATYAGFFVEGLRIYDVRLAAPVLLGCLVLLAIIIHLRRSQVVAGIAMFLVYYTIVASCLSGVTPDNIVYALGTLAGLALAGLIFHAVHRWFLFSWAAIVATYGVYLFYFLKKPAGLPISDLDYFWISTGFLAICYVVFAAAAIFDARKTGEYRRVVAPMSGLNSAIFFTLTWIAVREHYIEYEWLFRLGFAGGLLALAVLAQLTGPRRNYLYQIYIAKVVVMFTLALQAYMSGEKLMVAIAIECLALAFSYRRSGIITFKILGMLLMLASFAGCLFHLRTPGTTWIVVSTIPSNWFCVAGTAAVFVAVAWFYERHIRRIPPRDRVVTGQWFLADTFLDIYPATVALLFAAASALLLLSITVFDLGSDPRMPYLLAAEGVLLGLVGVVLRTPPVQIGGVLLLVACHVCYHIFLIVGQPGFVTQPFYVAYTVVVALFTYAGAYFWERYLWRVRHGRPWEHHVVAAIPYLVATFMLTTLLGQKLESIDLAISQNVLGVILLLAGALTSYPGVKASGVLAFTMGTASHYQKLYMSGGDYTAQPAFFWYLLILLGVYVMGERLFVVLERQEKAPSPVEDGVRAVFIGVCGAVGVIAFYRIADPSYLTLYWLGLAVSAVLFGGVFGEVRYRWAAILLFCAAIARAFAYDLRKLPPIYSFASFAALAVALMIVAWAYGRYRQRRLDAVKEAAQQEGGADG
ncbi:MAG TPA: DUF2339 domain-containing protein [Candidatus Bathyarchaeia archaeon]|nr:DUF2339 domain-containing protein [Candidatus Bathyarchaeia archaeon]